MCLQNKTSPWPSAYLVPRIAVLDVISVVNIIFIHRTWLEGERTRGERA